MTRAVIFTAVYSRHMFVWLSFTQSFNDVIAGFEAAWGFFGGVFKVVITDNMRAIVDKADPTNVVDVSLIARIAERGTPGALASGHRRARGNVVELRFARDQGDFKAKGRNDE